VSSGVQRQVQLVRVRMAVTAGEVQPQHRLLRAFTRAENRLAHAPQQPTAALGPEPRLLGKPAIMAADVGAVGIGQLIHRTHGLRHHRQVTQHLQVVEAATVFGERVALGVLLSFRLSEGAAQAADGLLMVRGGALLPHAVGEELLRQQVLHEPHADVDPVGHTEHLAGVDQPAGQTRGHVVQIPRVGEGELDHTPQQVRLDLLPHAFRQLGGEPLKLPAAIQQVIGVEARIADLVVEPHGAPAPGQIRIGGLLRVRATGSNVRCGWVPGVEGRRAEGVVTDTVNTERWVDLGQALEDNRAAPRVPPIAGAIVQIGEFAGPGGEVALELEVHLRLEVVRVLVGALVVRVLLVLAQRRGDFRRPVRGVLVVGVGLAAVPTGESVRVRDGPDQLVALVPALAVRATHLLEAGHRPQKLADLLLAELQRRGHGSLEVTDSRRAELGSHDRVRHGVGLVLQSARRHRQQQE